MNILVVTGTDTGVGKTVATAAISALAVARKRMVSVIKVAQTGLLPGEFGDIEQVHRLVPQVTVTELARYPEPLAPETAALRAGMPLLSLADVVQAVQGVAATSDTTIIEGAGGLLVRLGDNAFTLVDLAKAIDATIVVVARAGLGTLNHSALTVQAIEHAGLVCGGLIIGSWPAEADLASNCNREDLSRTTGVEVLGVLPADVGTLAPEKFAAAAIAWFDEDRLAQLLS